MNEFKPGNQKKALRVAIIGVGLAGAALALFLKSYVPLVLCPKLRATNASM
jgi:aspartate oxidase